jgi:hypothetical protein
VGEGVDQSCRSIGRIVGALTVRRIVEPLHGDRRTDCALPHAETSGQEGGTTGPAKSVSLTTSVTVFVLPVVLMIDGEEVWLAGVPVDVRVEPLIWTPPKVPWAA